MSNPRPSDGILATLPAATLQLYYTETGSTQAMHRRHSSTPGDGKIHFVNEEDGSPTRLKESPSRRKTFIRKIRTSIFKRKDDEEIPANVRRVSMPAGSLPALDTEAQPHHRTSITSSSPHRFIKRRTVSRQASMPGLSSDSVNGEKAGVTEPSTNVPVSNEEERTTSRGHRASSASTSRSSETASSSVATPEQHTTELHAEHQLVTSDSSSMKEPNIPFPSNSPSRPPSQSSVKASSHSHVHPHINRIRPTPGIRSVSLISRHSFDTASTDSIMETVDEDASFQPFCLPEDAVPVRIRAVSESNLPPSTSLIMVPKMTRSASDGSNDSSHPQGGATVHQAMSVPNLARINVVPPSPLVPVGLYKEEKGVQTSPVTQEFSVFIPPKSVEEAIETIRKINISEEVQTEPVPKSSAATQVQPKLESTGSQAQPQVVSSLTQTDSAITTTSAQSQVECCEELVFSALFNAASRLRYRFAGYHHHVGIRDFYKPTVVAVATVGVFAMVMPVASRIFRH